MRGPGLAEHGHSGISLHASTGLTRQNGQEPAFVRPRMGLLEQVYSSFQRLTHDPSGLGGEGGLKVGAESVEPARLRLKRGVSLPRLLICLGLVALLIRSTLPSVRKGLARPMPESTDPFYSSDAYLQAITGLPHASQRVIDVMSALPKEKPLLIFQRDRDSASSLLAMTMAYLSWPSEVRFELVRGSGCDRQLGAVAPDSVAAVAFCDLPAPTWIQGGIRLGSNSRLLPLQVPNENTR